jgi:hypothetical protein
MTICPVAEPNGQFRNRIKMRFPTSVMFSTPGQNEKFLPEYSRRSEEAHPNRQIWGRRGFCVGVPPQTGLIGVHNPKGLLGRWRFSAVAP